MVAEEIVNTQNLCKCKAELHVEMWRKRGVANWPLSWEALTKLHRTIEVYLHNPNNEYKNKSTYINSHHREEERQCVLNASCFTLESQCSLKLIYKGIQV